MEGACPCMTPLTTLARGARLTPIKPRATFPKEDRYEFVGNKDIQSSKLEPTLGNAQDQRKLTSLEGLDCECMIQPSSV
jgi:hypothetical protein